jgi:hypothetical protein
MPDNNPTNPTDGNLSDGQKKKLEDFIAQRFFEYSELFKWRY